MTSGNEVEQQTFDGASTQKWKFVYYGGGNIYTIRSAQNNSYYLGIENNSTADGANIVLRTGTITSGMKWRIMQGNQGYKVVSYDDPSMVISSNSLSVIIGQKIVLQEWMRGTAYQGCGEWKFFSTRLTVNLDVLYDVAYVNRYADAVDRITDQMIEMQKKYLTVFGIYINYSIPTPINSYADLACTINPNQRCAHAEDEVCENSALKITGDVDFKAFHHTKGIVFTVKTRKIALF